MAEALMPAAAPAAVYLKDLVAARLARRGLSGSVEIRPRTPLAQRLETGERALFVVEYHGNQTAQIIVDEWDISSGTVGAPVAEALANKLAARLQVQLAA